MADHCCRQWLVLRDICYSRYHNKQSASLTRKVVSDDASIWSLYTSTRLRCDLQYETTRHCLGSHHVLLSKVMLDCCTSYSWKYTNYNAGSIPPEGEVHHCWACSTWIVSKPRWNRIGRCWRGLCDSYSAVSPTNNVLTTFSEKQAACWITEEFGPPSGSRSPHAGFSPTSYNGSLRSTRRG